MTLATNGQITIAHELLALQTAYTTTFNSALPDDEKHPQLTEIAGQYADALIRFNSTLNGGRHIIV